MWVQKDTSITREPQEGEDGSAPWLWVVSCCPPFRTVRISHEQGWLHWHPGPPVVGYTLAVSGRQTHSPTWFFLLVPGAREEGGDGTH